MSRTGRGGVIRQDYGEIAAKGQELILRGEAVAAVDLLETVPPPAREPWLWMQLGDAYRTAADFQPALAAYGQVCPDLDRQGPLATALAWRVGLVHQQQGEPKRALDVYRRASTGEAALADRAWLLAGSATAHWLLGDCEEALSLARAAGDQAADAGDSRVLAAAHVAMALAVSLNGDPATVEEEYARAAVHAERAGDRLQVARIDANRSHHLLADARFAEAVALASAAAHAARDLGSATLLAVALGNEAEGLMRLGRYEDALDRCEEALSLSGAIGTRRTAGALVGLAQVHLRRGAREQARAALEQALRLQAEDPDRQVRVPALAYLTLAVLPEDVPVASASAAEALAEAKGSALLPALIAAGRAAWARGEVENARGLATRAVEHARFRRERAWLAEALELRATTTDKEPARAALREAQQIWRDANAIHDADRVALHMSRLASAVSDRVAGRLALIRLTDAGVLDAARFVIAAGRIRIATFGRFEVAIDGVPVPADAWQSRQARELLRLLVCRRGRAVPRPEICEILWPDDDPDRTGHRLSVLLSIVRGVLGPDALIADQACVALNGARVEVDVEQFLADVADAVPLHARGSTAEVKDMLAAAARTYTDEPFADAPYDDAATAIRDEARAAYLQALRLLAECCHRAGEHDEEAAYLRRLLGNDRYDEAAHRSLFAVLVRAGRHGQARLAASRYRTAMSELGLRPSDEGLRAVV